MKAVFKIKKCQKCWTFSAVKLFFDINLVKFNYFCLRLITKI